MAYRSDGLIARVPHQNPHSETCCLHLRRVCGACPHFSGEKIRQGGFCRMSLQAISGRDDASDCEHWTRKIARLQ